MNTSKSLFTALRNLWSSSAKTNNSTVNPSKTELFIAGSLMTIAGAAYYQTTQTSGNNNTQYRSEVKQESSYKELSREEALTMMREFDAKKALNEKETLGHKEDCENCCYKQN